MLVATYTSTHRLNMEAVCSSEAGPGSHAVLVALLLGSNPARGIDGCLCVSVLCCPV
jgi:hypothetical protein